MIPKTIHYCWFGRGEKNPLIQACIASWRKYLPDYRIVEWNEDSFDVDSTLWTRQAYAAKKWAFVSDYVRLWALEQYGGLYMDVDFRVYRPFDDLMSWYPAFAGYEGSKRQPVMQGVIASEPHGAWVRDMLQTYANRTFIKPDGSLDLTPNTAYFTDRLEAQGFVADGNEKDFFLEKENENSHADSKIFMLHVFPVHYFCPVLTTGEDVRNAETYCEHMGESSWAQSTWKGRLLRHLSPAWRTRLIKLKRKIWG